MARGKYGARAANRLAQTDNELLVATAAERDELKLKVASLTQELADAKASLSGAVIDEADKMSRKLIFTVVCPPDRAEAVAWDITTRHLLPVSYECGATLHLFGVNGPVRVNGPVDEYTGSVRRPFQQNRDGRTDQEDALHSRARVPLGDVHLDRPHGAVRGVGDRFRDQLRVIGQHAEALPGAADRARVAMSEIVGIVGQLPAWVGLYFADMTEPSGAPKRLEAVE